MLKENKDTKEEREEKLRNDIMIDNAIEDIRDRATYLYNCGRKNEINEIIKVGNEIEDIIRELIDRLTYLQKLSLEKYL